MTKQATPVEGMINVLAAETLPNGVRVVMTSCGDYDALKALPTALLYDGKVYGRTGWNSDRLVAYYRTDAASAMAMAL